MTHTTSDALAKELQALYGKTEDERKSRMQFRETLKAIDESEGAGRFQVVKQEGIERTGLGGAEKRAWDIVTARKSFALTRLRKQQEDLESQAKDQIKWILTDEKRERMLLTQRFLKVKEKIAAGLTASAQNV